MRLLTMIRQVYDEHLELLRESEVLRLEQARLMSNAAASVSQNVESELERAAASAHGDSYVSRLLSATKGWEWRDVELLLEEFREAPRALIVTGSLASGMVTVLAFLKANATGALFNLFARATSGAAISRELMDAALPLLLAVFCCVAGEWLANVARDFLFARARARRLITVRLRYLAAMLSQDAAFHDAHRSGELALRLSIDPDALDDAVLFTLERVLHGSLALCAGAYILFVDWRTLAFGLALRLPFALQFVEASVQTTTAYERLETSTAAAAGARAAECLANVRVLQSNTAEESELAGYGRLLGKQARVRRVAAGAVSILRHTERVVTSFSDVITLGFGGYRILRGSLSLGTFTALQSVMGIVIQEFNKLEAAYVGLRQAALRSRRYVALRDRIPAVGLHVDVAPAKVAAMEAEMATTSSVGAPTFRTTTSLTDGGDAAPGTAANARVSSLRRRRSPRRVESRSLQLSRSALGPAGRDEASAACGFNLGAVRCGRVLQFDDVSFSYPATLAPVLSHVSFVAAPGRVIAFVGPSGSGKSTVSRLAVRFFDPDSGRVLLDGDDVRTIDASALRRAIAVVDQDPALLDRSIIDNVTLGCEIRPPMDSVSCMFIFVDSFATVANTMRRLQLHSRYRLPCRSLRRVDLHTSTTSSLAYRWATIRSLASAVGDSAVARRNASALPERYCAIRLFLFSTRPPRRSTPQTRPLSRMRWKILCAGARLLSSRIDCQRCDVQMKSLSCLVAPSSSAAATRP